ncbi:acyl-CoA dehydrogenase [Niveispirillum sp. SYP-B3756]|uniref:acyl-CoA dehydrogenase family protein n=1 Tax=Niveispirillum sp. SYP-B3756 TaxID=2662178 RepID=UPI001291E107|nr:acyl-CoA dehydrogenase family protein [Niveispirillum sp. SYP-B3756]MQP68306.1 acyl-CoA dehydrogenase [Niveispirillum sp. SYP-B3756]
MSGVDAMNTIDQEELRDAARRLLTDKVDRRAPWGEGEADGRALVRDMVELGWHLLTAPEELGGLGQSFTALAPIYEEMGRALAPATLADTMAALDVISLDDSVAGAALRDRLIEGSAHIVVAECGSLGPRIDTTFPLLEGGLAATHLLLLPTAAEESCGIVDLGREGVTATPVETWDRSRSFAELALHDAPCERLQVTGGVAIPLVRAHKDLAMAWDSLGAARRSLDETVTYMGTRQQFGRPIGSFQALKHRAADHKVTLELARALAVHASQAYALRDGAWSDLAAQARLLATDAFHAITEDSVQMHGGIGFTWEFDCHLFLKRALMSDILNGAPELVRDRISSSVIARALRRE